MPDAASEAFPKSAASSPAARDALSDSGRIGRWLAGLGNSRVALAVLGVVSFFETFLIPVPMEAVMVPCMLYGRRRAWKIAIVALIGCLAASFFVYFASALLFDTYGRAVLEAMGWTEAFESFRTLMEDQGFWAILVVGVVPIPFQVALIAAGATGYSLPLFALATLLARGVRYLGLAALIVYAGPRALALWERHRITASVGAVAVLAVLWAGFHFLGPVLQDAVGI